MQDTALTTTRGPWRFVWHGGRLCDVFHAESEAAIDCVQVGDYDFREGKLLVPFEQATLETVADKWVRESGNDFRRELPYLL